MQFTDSHCHLDFDEFKPEFAKLLQQCQHNKIHRIIVPAVEPQHWQRVLQLSQQPNSTHVKLYGCLGIHPWFIILNKNLQNQKVDTTSYQQQLENKVNQHKNDIVAIGECGIDIFKAKKHILDEQALNNNITNQQDYFAMQLILAKKFHYPVVVHHCQSHQYIIPLLKHANLPCGGVIHAFSGSYQQAKNYLDLGFKLGIGGIITYSRAKKTINAIKRLPLESLVLETDAPSMPLAEQQGQINSPLNVVKIFQALTSIRPESETLIAEQLEQNVDGLFFNEI